MKKNKKKKYTDTKNGNIFIVKSIFIGSGIGIVTFFAFTALFALLAYTQDMEEKYYTAFLLFSAGISAFCSGFIAVLPIKRNGLFMGMLSTLPMYFFIVGVASVISRTGIGLYGWISLGIMLIFSGLGGIISANKRKRVKLK